MSTAPFSRHQAFVASRYRSRPRVDIHMFSAGIASFTSSFIVFLPSILPLMAAHSSSCWSSYGTFVKPILAIHLGVKIRPLSERLVRHQTVSAPSSRALRHIRRITISSENGPWSMQSSPMTMSMKMRFRSSEKVQRASAEPLVVPRRPSQRIRSSLAVSLIASFSASGILRYLAVRFSCSTMQRSARTEPFMLATSSSSSLTLYPR
mmetsp:Transcript_81706/g.210367  ORF Transcript_81706/g.210367 Transcript_81706/m.210367 type:complete len:207 (+) Transcript_81706:91-711(+)